jgi:glutaredoxin 3
LLKAKGIPFQEIDVTKDQALRQEVIRRTGRRTVPQIFIGEESIGGFTELRALDVRGELEEKLAD